MTRLINFIVIGILYLACSMSTAAQLRVANVHPDSSPNIMSLRYMSDILTEKSKGKHSLRIFSNSILGTDKSTLEMVRNGNIEMARVSIATFHDDTRESVIISLPFLFKDLNHFRKSMQGEAGRKLISAIERNNLIVLGIFESGMRSMYAKKPIKSAHDLNGVKIRVQPSTLWKDVIDAIGAKAVSLPMAETIYGLTTGLVDAAENNYVSYFESHHYETAAVLSETFHAVNPEILIISKKSWNTLSPDDQNILKESAKESVAYHAKISQQAELESKAKLIKIGVKIINHSEIDHTSFVNTQKPVWHKYANTTDLKSLIDIISAQ